MGGEGTHCLDAHLETFYAVRRDDDDDDDDDDGGAGGAGGDISQIPAVVTD